jgi:hypothetical protein
MVFFFSKLKFILKLTFDIFRYILFILSNKDY